MFRHVERCLDGSTRVGVPSSAVAEHTLDDVGVHARDRALGVQPGRPERDRRRAGHVSGRGRVPRLDRSALLLWELVSRTGLIDERDLPPMSSAVSRARLARLDLRVLERVRAHRVRLGGRASARLGARDPDRDRPRVEPARRERVPGADRVPPPDPVGSSDSTALPHARDELQERDLPRDVRRLLADPRADDVRRPRRRPGHDRHRTLVPHPDDGNACGGSRSRAPCRTSRPGCGSPPPWR